MTIMLQALPVARVRLGVQANVARRWQFDVPAIERALEQLGVEGQVLLVTTRGRTADGRHFYRECESNSGREHEIRVSAFEDAAGASRTLWHELSHAVQSERFDRPGAWRKAYRNADANADDHPRKFDRYWHNAYEREAREFESRAADQPLATRWP